MAADTHLIEERCNRVSLASRVAFRQSLGWKENDFVFAVIGRLISRKGVKEMLREWRNFDNPLKNVKLLFVGEGDLSEDINEFCQSRSDSDVALLSDYSYDDIHVIYASVDSLIVPTLEDNWSLVVPEAMACSLPIICSQFNGCWPELVTPENGIVVNPLSSGEISDAMTSLIQADISSMGKRSREIVESFTPDKAAQKIYSLCLTVSGEAKHA
jgi:glycosyltransferase involved in cell wall biosynthesis